MAERSGWRSQGLIANGSHTAAIAFNTPPNSKVKPMRRSSACFVHAHRQQQIQAQLGDGPGIVTVDEQGQIFTRKLSEQDIQDLREERVNIDDLLPQSKA